MGKPVLVFGSFVADLMSRAPHLPKPGETVKGSVFHMGPGGKGFNQGVAAHKAGADIVLVTKVGKDAFGELARDTMETLGMNVEGLLVSETAKTGTALILVDEGTSQNSILVVSGACGTITPAETASLEKVLQKASYLLVQLETNFDAVEDIVFRAKAHGVKVIFNPAPAQPVSDEFLAQIDIITPNEIEAEIFSGIPIDSERNARRAADYFVNKGVKEVVITWGERGVYALSGNTSRLFPAPFVKTVDTTGAGDAFNGGLVTALSEGKSLFEACVFANALASISVTRMGTTPSMPTRKEIDEFLEEQKIGKRNVS